MRSLELHVDAEVSDDTSFRLKALLFALVRAFQFELAVPHEDIVPMGLLVQRPTVRNELDKGAQLPMLIRAYQG